MMRRFGPILLVAFQAWGCSDARLLEGFAEGQTRIRLDPGEFVGFVPCLRDTPGALHTYVASFYLVDEDGQLVDALDGGAATALTSGPVSCDQGLSFPSLAARFYGAEILGFDRDITAAEVGTLEPRWSATCGRGSPSLGDAGLDPLRPTLSLRGSTVPMRGCTAFSDALPGVGLTQIIVDVQGALGDLRCGSGAGQVGFLEATLDGVRRTAACGAPLAFTLSGVVGGYHTLQLTAYELSSADAGVLPARPADAAPPGAVPVVPDAGADGGADSADASVPGVEGLIDAGPPQADAGGPPALVGVPRWRTRCIGRSVPGLATTAVCDPLEPLP